MKKYFKFLSLPLLAIIFNSCQPKDYKEIGQPISTLSSLQGTWKLAKVTQTDEVAAKKGFPYITTDLTTAFPYTDFKFTLNTDGNSPTTFSTTPGNSPKIIRLSSGKWMVDDPSYPKVLTLINGIDTANVTLGGYPSGISPSLKIKLEKNDAATGKLILSYIYEFIK